MQCVRLDDIHFAIEKRFEVNDQIRQGRKG